MSEARNVLCPHYSSCLDAAVKKKLPGWECRNCEHRNKVEPIDPIEAERCRRLLAKIFSTSLLGIESFNPQNVLLEF